MHERYYSYYTLCLSQWGSVPIVILRDDVVLGLTVLVVELCVIAARYKGCFRL